MATILIGGGSGLIGSRLSEMLASQGHKVLHLSRKENLQAKFPKHAWNLAQGTIDRPRLLAIMEIGRQSY